jgi:RNase H-fold protein (predicted Holliday junction resolvase)
MLEEQYGRKSKQSAAASKKKDGDKISVDSVAATIILREYLQRQNPAAREPR